VTALLLDLDDTLVPDYADFLGAVDDVAAALGAPAGMGAAVHARARRRWRDAPESALLTMTDMSSWEALWAPFADDLAEWADGFRLASWREALLDSEVDDRDLARRLARAYGRHRLARFRPYPEVAAVLDGLRGSVRLGLVTNGMEGHQRSKLDAAGLADRFDAIVTSERVGCSKPDPRIFHAALDRLGCRADAAIMVGDNPLRDVAGAQQAGLRAVWVDRDGGRARGVSPDARITDLTGLAALGWW
jgi:2-haloalkanoic acid dehalogenase type II